MTNSAFSGANNVNIRNVVLKSTLNSDFFNFAHINPGSLKPNLSEVQAVLRDVNLHALAVSETWYNDKLNSNLVKIEGFELIRHDRRNKRGGGVAFYLKSNLKYKTLFKSHPNSKVEFLFLEINNNAGCVFVLGVVYNPPANPRFDPLKRCLREISSIYENCLVLGDFNLNMLDQVAPVKRFRSFMSDTNFALAAAEPTNFVPNKRPSQIDLLLVNNLACLKRFSQISLGSFTSHDMLFGTYAVSMSACSARPVRFLRNIKRIIPENIQLAASSLNWDLIYSLVNIDDQIEHLNTLLMQLLNQFAPLRPSNISSRNYSEWFTPALEKLINERNYAHAAWKTEKNPVVRNELYEVFKRKRNKVTTMKRNAKANFFNRLLDSKLPPKRLWGNLKEFGVTQTPPNQAENFSPEDFNSYFGSVFTAPSNTPTVQNNDSANSFFFECVSNIEVFSTISSIKTIAVGVDGIPANFLKKMCPFLIPFLTYIINNCITRSFFRNIWKIAIVNPIPKVTCAADISDFRPISILPALSKTLERIMKNQLTLFLDTKNSISRFQSGFRPKHSTNTALLKVVDDLSAAMENGNVTIAAFLDFKKAFDLVDHDLIIHKLHSQFQISSTGCSFVKSYLSNRWQKVRVGEDVSNAIEVTSGTPQGGILSALLFSLYINDLPSQVNISSHLYADDSNFYCSAPNVNTCASLMNIALKQVHDWTLDNFVSVNAKKSNVLVMSQNKSLSITPSIMIGANPLMVADKVTYLGLVLNSTLDWTDHIAKTCGEIFGCLAMLRKSQSITPISTKKRLVQALLVPKFLYCCNIFVGCNRMLWAKLNLAFNACLRYIFGLRKFDSISSHENEIFGCSLENYMKFRSCLYIFNLLKTGKPGYLYEKLEIPRHQRNCLLKLPSNRSSSQRMASFFVHGIRLWNSLSNDLRNASSVMIFRHECLDYFASLKS